MNGREYLRLGLRILDEQVVDSEGRRCGRVEDLELEGELGGPARVAAILCGATAWKRRLPPSVAELVPGDPPGLSRVRWEVVEEIGNEILLGAPEAELERVASADGRPLAISQLIGTTVVDQRGRERHRVRDVVASRSGDGDASRPLELDGVLVGMRGVLQRAGFWSRLDEQIREGQMPPNHIPWNKLQRLDDEGRLVLSAS